ncbi:MAG: peptidoglycan bridge formation glycyltransferase FemA/FemB family protein [Bacteroidota bacterium]|nr:peptidoglycan bridge formation glycyltransferase FemA/FemB family protein [Bacteroidota bacterium]
MKYTVQIKTPNEIIENEFSELLLSTSTNLLYSSLPYLKLLQYFLNCEVIIITVLKDKSIVGCFPLAFKNNLKHGCVCNSLPFYGSNGGMIVSESVTDKNEVRTILKQEFEKIVQHKSCVAYTIISNPLDVETDNWLRNNVSHDQIDERIGQITHFPKGIVDIENDLMKSFEDPRPRNIRKAIKEGVNIYATNDQDAIDFLYKVHYDNIKAINGIPKEKKFFDLIPKFFNNTEYKIYIAEYKGERVGALLLFYFNKTVEYFTPAVIESHRNLQPTSLIIYKAMIEAIKDGYENWNWGGTWLTQGGVYDFKKKWGTTDHHYFYYTKIYKEDLYTSSKEFLLQEYPYFFVLPFSSLKQS